LAKISCESEGVVIITSWISLFPKNSAWEVVTGMEGYPSNEAALLERSMETNLNEGFVVMKGAWKIRADSPAPTF
jgi:hypothetical protein